MASDKITDERLAAIRANIEPWLTGTPISVRPFVDDMIDLLAEVDRQHAAMAAAEDERARMREIVLAVAVNEYRPTTEDGPCEYLLCLPGDLRLAARAMMADEIRRS